MSIRALRMTIAAGALAVIPLAAISEPVRPASNQHLAPPMLIRPEVRKPRTNPGCPGGALGAGAFVGGGFANVASGTDSAVLGGQDNQSCDKLSGIGAGYLNIVANGGSAKASYVAAGEVNTVSGFNSFLGAGFENSVSGPDAFVGAGFMNSAEGAGAFVGAGGILFDDHVVSEPNRATGDDSFVGAGSANWADSDGSFLGAGIDNEIVPGTGSGTRSTAYSAIAAGNNNTITLTGGTAFVSSFIGAGAFNVVSAGQSVVTGGYGNRVSQGQSFVGAGNSNFVGNTYAFDGAGVGNRVTASRAFIGAGFENVAAGTDAAVPGGDGNVANGAASFAAGTGSHALHNGTFVWSDDATNATTLKSSGANQFLVRASGGVNLYSSAKLASGVRLAPGSGTWSSLSDRNAKTNIVPTDSHAILERVAALPISEWSYRTEDPHVRHLGPMAQDFYAAFGVGEDDRHVTSLDEEGVALAAIKALEAQVRDLAARDAELENRIAALQAR